MRLMSSQVSLALRTSATRQMPCLSCSNLKAVLTSADASAADLLVVETLFTRTELSSSLKPAAWVIALRACFAVKSARTLAAEKATSKLSEQRKQWRRFEFPCVHSLYDHLAETIVLEPDRV